MKLPDTIFGTSTKEAYKRVLDRLNNPIEEKNPDNTPTSQKIEEKYEIMPANTYEKGIHTLKETNEQPLTVEENLEARLKQKELNNECLSSGTGIVNKANSTKFKIINNCEELKNIPKELNKKYINVNYKKIIGEGVTELNSEDPHVKYNKGLTPQEAKEHPAWLAVANNNKTLLNKNVDNHFNRTGNKKGMGFYVRKNTEKSELRAVTFDSVNANSNAGGILNLYNRARFLRKAQTQKQK